MQRRKRSGPGGLLILLASAAVAAETPPRDATKPSGERAEAYSPALPGYRRADLDEPLRDWRGANHEAGRLGGHGGQLESATQAQPGPSGRHGEHR